MSVNQNLEESVETKCKEIINQLREYREEKNYTTYKLAEESSIRQPNITRMETFDSIPNLKTIVTIAEALQVDIIIQKRENFTILPVKEKKEKPEKKERVIKEKKIKVVKESKPRKQKIEKRPAIKKYARKSKVDE